MCATCSSGYCRLTKIMLFYIIHFHYVSIQQSRKACSKVQYSLNYSLCDDDMDVVNAIQKSGKLKNKILVLPSTEWPFSATVQKGHPSSKLHFVNLQFFNFVLLQTCSLSIRHFCKLAVYQFAFSTPTVRDVQ